MDTVTSAQLRRAEARHRRAAVAAEEARRARNEIVRKAAREGWSQAELAHTLGLTGSRVGQICKIAS
jgi:ribosome-binding protein aMBF1 (putative translation factor)